MGRDMILLDKFRMDLIFLASKTHEEEVAWRKTRFADGGRFSCWVWSTVYLGSLVLVYSKTIASSKWNSLLVDPFVRFSA
jgi:hypothetical protein